MPAKNRTKNYVENSHYHVYNRGVEKRNIFLDDYDYRVFMNLLKIYLHPVDKAKKELQNLFPEKRIRVRKTFHGDIKILAFCLMPNHFHLLVYQNSLHGITEFLRSVCTAYSMYFNKKYKRVGSLFQGVYKAVSVPTDEYILHLSRYIHRNPLSLTGLDPVKLWEYPYSSLSTYTKGKTRSWIDTTLLFGYFEVSLSPSKSYEEFVVMLEDSLPISHLVIEDN